MSKLPESKLLQSEVEPPAILRQKSPKVTVNILVPTLHGIILNLPDPFTLTDVEKAFKAQSNFHFEDFTEWKYDLLGSLEFTPEMKLSKPKDSVYESMDLRCEPKGYKISVCFDAFVGDSITKTSKVETRFDVFTTSRNVMRDIVDTASHRGHKIHSLWYSDYRFVINDTILSGEQDIFDMPFINVFREYAKDSEAKVQIIPAPTRSIIVDDGSEKDKLQTISIMVDISYDANMLSLDIQEQLSSSSLIVVPDEDIIDADGKPVTKDFLAGANTIYIKKRLSSYSI